jgi:Ca-activated chloride channel family protein
MHQPSFICGLLVLTLLAHRADAQTNPTTAQSTSPYRFSVSVDEVSLTFHAADAHGLPVNDLKLNELSLLDNGKPPRRILALDSLQNFPIRAGILMDTSQSMDGILPGNRAIATQYAQRLLRQQTDQAFVMDFGYISRTVQPWTSDPIALTNGIRKLTAGKANPLGGTALFDTIFRACFNEFGKIDHAASGNFILLFSDGEDNASHTSLQEAVDICQRSNTAIYAFRAEPKLDFSPGPKALADLASETGGRLFFSDDSEAEIYTDLRAIEADLRNQYRLIYNPAELKHDASFRRIELRTPERVDSVKIRSGYYDLPR